MVEVAIVMGSDSDLNVMRAAGDFLKEMGVEYEYNIISAHREPDIFFAWARDLKKRGIKTVIAGAGKAAHLPGNVCGTHTSPCNRSTDKDFRSWRCGFFIFYSSDAGWNSGSDRGYKRCKKCGNTCHKDTCLK